MTDLASRSSSAARIAPAACATFSARPSRCASASLTAARNFSALAAASAAAPAAAWRSASTAASPVAAASAVVACDQSNQQRVAAPQLYDMYPYRSCLVTRSC